MDASPAFSQQKDRSLHNYLLKGLSLLRIDGAFVAMGALPEFKIVKWDLPSGPAEDETVRLSDPAHSGQVTIAELKLFIVHLRVFSRTSKTTAARLEKLVERMHSTAFMNMPIEPFKDLLTPEEYAILQKK